MARLSARDFSTQNFSTQDFSTQHFPAIPQTITHPTPALMTGGFFRLLFMQKITMQYPAGHDPDGEHKKHEERSRHGHLPE
jgi:hypothetical protein